MLSDSVYSNTLLPSIPNLPVLKQRKDIWNEFPVNLVPLGRGEDGAERHAIEWNRRKVLQAREALPEDLWHTFELDLEAHLLTALRSSSAWSVELPQTNKQLCVIRMSFPKDVRKPAAPDVTKDRSVVPLLTCLNDIKRFFPVVWHCLNDGDNNAKKSYTIELHHSAVRELSASLGYKADETLQTLLLTALHASTSWTVEETKERGEVCRITMA